MQVSNSACSRAMRAVSGCLWWGRMLGQRALRSIAATLLVYAYLLGAHNTIAQPSEAQYPEAQHAHVDRWEAINRPLYAFNDVFDGYIVKPVSLTYDRLIPRFAKRGVGNFVANIDEVNVIANDLLQLKMDLAVQDSARFLVNSTAGMGGFLDVAGELGLYKHYEDFGQTLGYWGLGDGGYLVVPFLGASTVRDTVGLVPDLLLNPIYWVTDSNARSALYALDTIDTRLSYVAAESMITGDEYEFVRNAYLQRREYLVQDGAVYDEFDEY